MFTVYPLQCIYSGFCQASYELLKKALKERFEPDRKTDANQSHGWTNLCVEPIEHPFVKPIERHHLSEVRSGGTLCPWLCKSAMSKPVHT